MQPESSIAPFNQELELLSLVLFGVSDIRALIRFSQYLHTRRNFARTSPDLSVPFESVLVLFTLEFLEAFSCFQVSCPRTRQSNQIASQAEPSHRVTFSSVSKFFSYPRDVSSKIWRNRIVHVKPCFGGGCNHVLLAPCPTDPLRFRLLYLVEDFELFGSRVGSEVFELGGPMYIHISICLGAFYFPCKFPPVYVNVSHVLLLCALLLLCRLQMHKKKHIDNVR